MAAAAILQQLTTHVSLAHLICVFWLNAVAFAELDDDYTDASYHLHAYLKKRARLYMRPVKNPSEHIDIHVYGALYQIVDLDQRNNLATISAYFDVWWYDYFLRWNASEFEGHDHIFLPTHSLWKPEFYLYHSIMGSTPHLSAESAVEVQSDGRVRMFIPLISRALCPINVKYFPFDTQMCSFLYGSWSYRTNHLRYSVSTSELFLGDFYDNQEWLLTRATLENGTTNYEGNETYSMVVMNLHIRRQAFYYVFNLVIPTTLVSLVAVIGFHAPINSTGRRETKFRLGIMTLLSMAVMLLMLVDEMPKFALESIPGQRGSFSDVPLLGLFYISLILTISVCTCTSSLFVHIEKYALRNPDYEKIPRCLRFLTYEKLLSPSNCFLIITRRYQRDKNGCVKNRRTANQQQLIASLGQPKEPREDSISHSNNIRFGTSDEAIELRHKFDSLLTLIKTRIEQRDRYFDSQRLAGHWNRLIDRLENASLTFYLLLITLNIAMFYWPEVWY